MAKNSLKIVNGDDTINEAGYVAVIENIILNAAGLAAFSNGGSGFNQNRTAILITHANSAGGTLTQRNEIDQAEAVTVNNCRIRAEVDERKANAGGFNKVTLSLPEEALQPADLTYIDDYITKFLMLWGNAPLPAATSVASAETARKFMFGVMMLTKCR